MGKYIKMFETDGDRTSYESSANFSVPYISYSKGSGEVLYLSSFTKKKSEAEVGDLVLKGRVIVSPENYSSKFSSREVIGIVAIPASHMPDNRLRMISLDYMSFSNPKEGSSEGDWMMWGASGDISGMKYYNLVPYLESASSTEISGPTDWSRIPTDYFSGSVSEINGSFRYWSNTETNRFCPPIYLSDGSINPLARAIYGTVPGTSTTFTINNALTDFDGETNTALIMKNCTVTTPTNSNSAGNYPAAHLCSLYSKGGVSWYLPAQGESAYIISKFGKLDSSRQLIGRPSYNYLNYWYWTSTLDSSSNVRAVNGYAGDMSYTDRSNLNSDNRVFALSAF